QGTVRDLASHVQGSHVARKYSADQVGAETPLSASHSVVHIQSYTQRSGQVPSRTNPDWTLMSTSRAPDLRSPSLSPMRGGKRRTKAKTRHVPEPDTPSSVLARSMRVSRPASLSSSALLAGRERAGRGVERRVLRGVRSVRVPTAGGDRVETEREGEMPEDKGVVSPSFIPESDRDTEAGGDATVRVERSPTLNTRPSFSMTRSASASRPRPSYAIVSPVADAPVFSHTRSLSRQRDDRRRQLRESAADAVSDTQRERSGGYLPGAHGKAIHGGKVRPRYGHRASMSLSSREHASGPGPEHIVSGGGTVSYLSRSHSVSSPSVAVVHAAPAHPVSSRLMPSPAARLVSPAGMAYGGDTREAVGEHRVEREVVERDQSTQPSAGRDTVLALQAEVASLRATVREQAATIASLTSRLEEVVGGKAKTPEKEREKRGPMYTAPSPTLPSPSPSHMGERAVSAERVRNLTRVTPVAPAGGAGASHVLSPSPYLSQFDAERPARHGRDEAVSDAVVKLFVPPTQEVHKVVAVMVFFDLRALNELAARTQTYF
ncbi:hypothetical protein KIPB_012445, partial [Kipferlia bialata]